MGRAGRKTYHYFSASYSCHHFQIPRFRAQKKVENQEADEHLVQGWLYSEDGFDNPAVALKEPKFSDLIRTVFLPFKDPDGTTVIAVTGEFIA
jgi:hypothetical protein